MSTCQKTCCIQGSRTDCAEMETYIVAPFLKSVFLPENSYSEFASTVVSEVLERWRFLKKKKKINGSAWYFLACSSLQHICSHTAYTQCMWKLSMNVAMVALWPMFIRVGRTTCSVVFFVFFSHFKGSFYPQRDTSTNFPLSLLFCPLLCPPVLLCLN